MKISRNIVSFTSTTLCPIEQRYWAGGIFGPLMMMTLIRVLCTAVQQSWWIKLTILCSKTWVLAGRWGMSNACFFTATWTRSSAGQWARHTRFCPITKLKTRLTEMSVEVKWILPIAILFYRLQRVWKTKKNPWAHDVTWEALFLWLLPTRVYQRTALLQKLKEVRTGPIRRRHRWRKCRGLLLTFRLQSLIFIYFFFLLVSLLELSMPHRSPFSLNPPFTFPNTSLFLQFSSCISSSIHYSSSSFQSIFHHISFPYIPQHSFPYFICDFFLFYVFYLFFPFLRFYIITLPQR